MAGPVLIVFSGLPGTGKSSIARQLALELDAMWLRIDSIEQAIRESGVLRHDVDGAGYAVGYRLARDNLAIGRIVVADSVNPWMLTRDAWRSVGTAVGVPVLEVETVCSDLVEHRRRIETRETQVAGLRRLGWDGVIGRDYHPWDRDRLVLDTAHKDVRACVARTKSALSTLSA